MWAHQRLKVEERKKEKYINYVFAATNNKNKLLQNGAMTAGRGGQESERYTPAPLIHSPEVRGQNHQYVGRVGFPCVCVLTGLQLRPQLSGPALHQEGPAVSGSPQLLPGCSKHTTSFDIWT